MAARGPAAHGPPHGPRPGGLRPTLQLAVPLPAARGPPHAPRPGGPRPTSRSAARAIYLLQDGGYSTRETGNYQNNTPLANG